MTVFKNALSRATDRVYAQAGVAAVYQDRDAVQTPCTVLVERDLSRFGDVAQVNVRTAVVAVRRSQVAGAPRRGERFTLTEGAEVLTVESLQASDELEHRVFAA